MKRKELILVLIIVGYLLAILSINVIEREKNYEYQPLNLVEVFENGTTRKYIVEDPYPIPSIFGSLAVSMIQLLFAFPFVIAGTGLLSFPIGFIQNGFTIRPEAFTLSIFWIISIITIPINYIFTKNFSKWYRIPYIYVLAALIAGTPILLSENFGR